MQKRLHPLTDEAIFHELTALMRGGEAAQAKVLLSQRFVRPAAGASGAVGSTLSGRMDDASAILQSPVSAQPLPALGSSISAQAGETQVSF